MSRYQKSKTNLDFTEARDSEWQWHQLGHMQVYTSPRSRQITMQAPHHSVTGRMPFLPPNQQRQSTEGCNVEDLNFGMQNLRPSNINVIFQRPSCGSPIAVASGFIAPVMLSIQAVLCRSRCCPSRPCARLQGSSWSVHGSVSVLCRS